jgi:hypothetical protein
VWEVVENALIIYYGRMNVFECRGIACWVRKVGLKDVDCVHPLTTSYRRFGLSCGNSDF